MGRPKARSGSASTTEFGWLDLAQPLTPDDEVIAAAVGGPRRVSTAISRAAPRTKIGAWIEPGVSDTAIHAA
jgi:hypothetical protein